MAPMDVLPALVTETEGHHFKCLRTVCGVVTTSKRLDSDVTRRSSPPDFSPALVIRFQFQLAVIPVGGRRRPRCNDVLAWGYNVAEMCSLCIGYLLPPKEGSGELTPAWTTPHGGLRADYSAPIALARQC
ncbi:hypothetical protein BaRGS_00008121 [Batillaria attramentaria]|uniref:Uncharacterized protein n=1 Tax=Batillaria attramentaria TaxID=370345 RepID=A0ABD0LLW4_9CAEN